MSAADFERSLAVLLKNICDGLGLQDAMHPVAVFWLKPGKNSSSPDTACNYESFAFFYEYKLGGYGSESDQPIFKLVAQMDMT